MTKSFSLIAVDWEKFKIHYFDSKSWWTTTILHRIRAYHTIPYTTEVYGLSISAILYGRWTHQLRSYKFLSLIMPNNKINRKKIPSADALLISNEQWWNGSCFFSQRCQNIIIFHIIEQKNTVFMQWLTSSLSLQKPIRCCP